MSTLSEKEVRDWWEEFERELAKMTVPCVPMPEPKQEPKIERPSKVSFDDSQFMIEDKKDD